MNRRRSFQQQAPGAQADSSNHNLALSRRRFLGLLAAAAGTQVAGAHSAAAAEGERNIYIVPNFHPASCGWLTTFSRERVYCANSYLTHLDRVGTDLRYAFVLSEINNIIAIMNFRPERIAELKARIHEQRVELVNGMFLEPTINLSGGEALVRMGVLGLRWYQQVFNIRPRYAWIIDVCGTHEQMAQIASGLGLDAMVYTRKNPTGKTMYWSVSPDGSKILTLSPGHYSEAEPIFSSKTPLTADQLQKLDTFFTDKDSITPAGAPVLVLGGGDDYSCAPEVKEYPSQFLNQWQALGSQNRIRFSTLSQYVDVVRPGIQSGKIQIPTTHAGTAYDFDAFWIENPEVKTRYRANEQALQAAEMLSTVASLRGNYSYPVKDIYSAWILMCLNMDRNTLWGSAGGMVFVSDNSWDARDRFDWVGKTTTRILDEAGRSLLPQGSAVGLFNPLNWKRTDPVALALPAGKSLEGMHCEALHDGSVLCSPTLRAFSIGGCKLSDAAPSKPQTVETSAPIETATLSAQIDPKTGALSSLRLKPSGRELLGGQANVIVAERPVKEEKNPGDFMSPRPGRVKLDSSSDGNSEVSVARGPVATTATIIGRFWGGGTIIRRVRFYHDHPRIDFETELNDVPDYSVVVAEFPLAEDVAEVRRGIPYGFAHSGWARPNPNLPGWNKGIVPAVRWMDFELTGGGGVALLDRGLTGRELNRTTPVIYLLNAEDQYHKFDNPWTTGKGKHVLNYALLPHATPWEQARIPRLAWEYNQPPVFFAQAADRPFESFLETSDNIVVEALRREQNHIELRFAECLGLPGTATVELALHHGPVHLTDLIGNHKSTLTGADAYTIPVMPQQIVTLHFETAHALAAHEPITAWDEFVPKNKLAALHAYDPNVKGHPPFGTGSTEF
ncbi:MAG TPA: glycoside hydrolase family 38 C-terminal domain-containing protein [Terracidiphilus sp.]|jgi:alpha-mannosidase|nr:glycoside hydrolase family 38 C-terminal domain-containing protein [Terracidiphilus sp.]